jgi:hypothetical protein
MEIENLIEFNQKFSWFIQFNNLIKTKVYLELKLSSLDEKCLFLVTSCMIRIGELYLFHPTSLCLPITYAKKVNYNF